MDVEDVLQTKILFTSSNVLQVNVTVPLLQDLIALGSYSDNLDRDGDGDLDVEDLANAVQEANFLPYELNNETGLDLEFWFPGDDMNKKSDKMVVSGDRENDKNVYRFDIPEDRKITMSLPTKTS